MDIKFYVSLKSYLLLQIRIAKINVSFDLHINFEFIFKSHFKKQLVIIYASENCSFYQIVQFNNTQFNIRLT